MQCTDCHVTDRSSTTGNFLPVTFEKDCKSCHALELEFDVYGLLKPGSPAPHAKDPQAIHEFIVASYKALLKSNAAIARRPLGNDVAAQPNAEVWLNKVVAASESYLFGKSGWR